MKIYFTKHVVRVLIFSVLSLSLFAQSIKAQTITGKITSKQDGFAIPGANITLKGTNRGTSSNENGTYSIEAVGNNSVLIVSFVGFETQEIRVGNRKIVDATLEPSTSMLNEVVVTALGIKRSEKSLTLE